MNLFRKQEPIFLKETSDAEFFINQLKELSNRVPENQKKELDKQIKMASYGKIGEDNIAFELKNSGVDMYILRDIYLEYGDLSAQIDYLVVMPV